MKHKPRWPGRGSAVRRLLAAACLLLVALQADAHSVGQVQTTKYFAAETVQLLRDRIAAGQAGFQVGDTLSYIIQFTPIGNGANIGVAGYITDYVPAGTEVIAADIAQKSGPDTFYPVAPALPGGIDTGWGDRGQNLFLAPFSTSAYDPTGRCAALGYANNCNSRLTELYADTGIFFSTDPRTAQYPPQPLRIAQGTNGYNINPTGAAKLNALLGQTVATTHNLWDADQTNAFGSTAAALAVLAAPKSAATALTAGGRGPTPYLAGSAVAGPQTGYPLDNTAQIGPWQRIAYPGSRIGDAATGPATLPGLSLNSVGGAPTALGYNLSPATPLPSGTNAVRWAVGRLQVGLLNYVRIKLRVTQPLPPGGITNGSEVFGGDAAEVAGGQDNTWRYHVPSVADINSNLLVIKTPCVYDATATNCTPLSGGYYAANSTITYQVSYINTSNAPQTNVVLSDFVPCQTAAGANVRIGSVTGPLGALTPLNTLPYTTNTAAGNCTAPQTRTTLTFPTIATLAPGDGGRMIINIKNTATTIDSAVVNTAKLTSTAVPAGVTSNGVTFVGSALNPALTVSKSTPTPTSTAGGTAQYVIVVENTGTGPATGLQIDDILPSTGSAVVNPATRFNFTATASISSSGLVTTTVLVTSTTTAALSGLAPYATQPGAANKVALRYAFGPASTLAAGGKITITFNVSIGSAVNASATPYYNNVVTQGTVGSPYRVDSGDAAPVTISGALSIGKTLECYVVGGTCVAANAYDTIPSNSRVRYRINYANTGSGTLNNVVLTDTLPCQISAPSNTITVTAVLSGPIAPTGTTPFIVPGPFSGNCPATRGSFSFPSATLNAGQTGTVQIDVQLTTPPSTTTVVLNDVSLSNGTFSATAQQQSTVLNLAHLLISKSVSPAAVAPGGTVNYTITLSNVGTTAAQTITVYDWLPTGTSTLADSTRRFNYTGTTTFNGALVGVGTTVNLPPTQAPYNTGPYAANQQELAWVFAGQTLPVGATASIAFASVVGANLPTLAPPNYYYNNAKVLYHSGQQASAGAAAANVTVVANLSVTKTNGTTAVTSGGTTSYTIVASNGGPSAANGTVLKDYPGAGLSCSTVTCPATTGGATCPATPANLLLPATGAVIPAFPAGSTVTLLLQCAVTASGLP